MQPDQFNAGERATLDLAVERTWHALINERKAHGYGAEILRVMTVSVPETLVTVVYAGFLRKTEALHLLDKLGRITSRELMLQAVRLIERAP